MNAFFLLVEFSVYIYVAYLFIEKEELTIIYFPTLFFAQSLITPVLPALLGYLLFSSLILFFIYRNVLFFTENIFSVLFVLLTIFLIPKSNDLVTIRPFLFSIFWISLLIPLIVAIYRKYPGRIIFQELATASFVILCLFIVNVIVASLAGYAPYAMYGITSGILYGNLYATDFNVLAIALFIVLLKIMSKKDLAYFIVFVLSLSFIMLSMRRSVMGLCAAGIIFTMLIFLTPQNFKSMAGFTLFFALLGFIIVVNTSFLDLFTERYELRDLDNRELAEEKRFFEYELIYNDMFVYQDYSPWVGYGLFDSGGNYGKGILGTRTLHADVTSILHSFGLIGLTLYLLMFVTMFKQAYSRSDSRTDYLIVFFCALVFIVYTITGRYTNIGTFVLLTLLLMLPLTKKMPAKKRKVIKVRPQEMANTMSPQLK